MNARLISNSHVFNIICTFWDDKLSPSHVVESVAYDCFVECGVMQTILTPQHHQLFFQ
jgi:hypothetical protein